jgi:hypothetical protein
VTNEYQDTLSCISDKGSTTTRRSAGLPSLITGLLGADPGGPLFLVAMKDLQKVIQSVEHDKTIHGDPLPQVHALNCLKAIFISTVLGPSSEPYIVSALDIAGQCLTSKTWAIRNCGLMLFRALIDRLLGSTDSHNWSEDGQIKTPRLSYNDYPTLLDIVLKLLTFDTSQPDSPETALESVFPALKILQRVPPPQHRRTEIRELVLGFCGSSHWHVRDMAARTLSGLVPELTLLQIVDEFVPDLSLGQNSAHGRLLCISYVVKSRLRDANNETKGKF